MSDAPASLFFGGNLPIGHIKLILQPSTGIHTDLDGSKWLASGAVVPAVQADSSLINTDLRCVKANLDINLPVTLTAAARFALTSSVTWIIDAAGAVLYSTDGGATWNNTTPSGGGGITFFIGSRNTGSGVEVFAGSSSQVFRAVITNAAPQTVVWSVVATISNAGNFSGGSSYAFDGTNHLICWPYSSTTGNIVSLISTNGTSWSENIVAATNAYNGYKCAVTAKAGGGFRVVVGDSADSSGFNCYSTATGASFTKLNTSRVAYTALFNGDRLFIYIGARLFLFARLSSTISSADDHYSDDNGVTWSRVFSLYSAASLGAVGTGGASWDGTTLSFVAYASAAGAYLVSTTDGINFKCTQLFMSNAEISNFNIGQVIGQRFVFIPPSSTKNKLFNIKNAFTPNASTDFVGMANRNAPYTFTASNNLVYGVKIQ